MAWEIVKITIDGVTMTGCRYTTATTDQETGLEGVAEATVTAASSGTTLTLTSVASPTTTPSIGVPIEGITYVSRGRWERCAVCGFTFPIREMQRQRGAYVDRDCYDQRIPIRGKGGTPPRRWSSSGGF